MRIEVDQSGKIEDLRQDVIVAFSNSLQYSVCFDRRLRREIIQTYKNEVRQIIPKLFSICVSYCIKDYIDKIDLVTIDLEYPGWEAFIKRELLRIIDIDKDKIMFDKIGKKSLAHKLALRTNRREEKPNKILTKKEVLRYLK